MNHEDAIGHLSEVLDERASDLEEAREHYDSCVQDLNNAKSNLDDAQYRHDAIKKAIDVLSGNPQPTPIVPDEPVYEQDYALARKVIGQL